MKERQFEKQDTLSTAEEKLFRFIASEIDNAIKDCISQNKQLTREWFAQEAKMTIGRLNNLCKGGRTPIDAGDFRIISNLIRQANRLRWLRMARNIMGCEDLYLYDHTSKRQRDGDTDDVS